MDGTIIVAIITVLGSIIAAAITSYLTKAKDREAEWRSVKLAHYKRFMTALLVRKIASVTLPLR